MMSLMENVRVFESSEDVRLHPSSYNHLRAGHESLCNRRTDDEENEAKEDEHLHPQHPSRMRKCVLQQSNKAMDHVDRNESSSSLMQETKRSVEHERRSMELLFLSSGDIRSRNDCPFGGNVPLLQQEKLCSRGNAQLRVEECGVEEWKEDSDEFGEDDETNGRQTRYESGDGSKTKGDVKTLRRPRRQAGEYRQHDGVDPLLSVVSKQPFSSLVEDAAVSSNDDTKPVASKKIEESGKQEKDRLSFHEQQPRQAAPNADEQERSAKVARDGVKRSPMCLFALDHTGSEKDDGTSGQIRARAHSAQHTTSFCNKEAPSSEDTSQEPRQWPATMGYVSRLDLLNDVPARRARRSPKMEVSHLILDEPTSCPYCRSSTKKEDNMVDRLETKLQKEKRRVLEKTACLLAEQGKNQQLCDKIEVLEAQLAVDDSDIWRAAREQDKQRQSSEKDQDGCVNKLEEQTRLQQADIASLTQDKMQLKTALKQLENTGSKLSSNQQYDTMEVAGLRAELTDMIRRLYDFLAKVDRWKSTSKEKMQNVDDEKSDLPAILEKMWLDFPQFTGVLPRPHTGSPLPSFEPQQQSMIGVDEQTDVVFCLKQRLRRREEQLRQTHIKYAELKEMCARQCVREADLQNFINEHRLRGNLIIRKDSTSKPKGADNNQEQVQKDQHDEQRRSATLKKTPSGDTNTPASCNERGNVEKCFGNEEYLGNSEEDNDECEEEGELGDSLPTPKVFAHASRDNVYEHASSTNSAAAQQLTTDRSREKRRMQPKKQQRQEQQVERIRLGPLPSLAQRYERVPTPTTKTGAPKRNAARQSRIQPMLGDCPPGCGSHSSFMRKKTLTAAARAKRPVTTTLKGSVVRPWV